MFIKSYYWAAKNGNFKKCIVQIPSAILNAENNFIALDLVWKCLCAFFFKKKKKKN